MQEMIEPDRTILIVSVIGLIVIWGSVAYHKFVQDSAPAFVDDEQVQMLSDDAQTADAAPTNPSPAPKPAAGQSAGSKSTSGKKRKKGGKGR
ncbi:MAG: hypothetical protein HOM68_26265 [Gemmatimonadetes bacterium]|jgi:hypothetical protein|nr:hypothetical protein [Gemmatimonadota bacterium]MBT4612593.1 hypothetical protein [Gemmatimonadota bacterium]MBT5060074.1 hypothetical protein [Gemmatimonadota bacterium]MBT5141996.1 hypothetical protein [Gemmatimonadota bacterium]MBT5589714.1 hypothetical protein [Gemmatimonadota bacterium]